MIAKSNGTLIDIVFKSGGIAMTTEKSKEIVPTIKQRRLKAIEIQGAIEKSPIILSQFWEKLVIGEHHD